MNSDQKEYSGTVSQTVRPPRMANYELLRIVAMFMVVCLHYLSNADVLTRTGAPAGTVQVLANLFEALCIASVNVYVLITGYFLSKSGFRFGRILSLMLEILFYTLLIPLVLSLIGIPLYAGNAWQLWFYIFPVSMESYWFITAYVILYLLSQLLNAGIEKLSGRQLKLVIIGLLFFYCFMPSVSPVRLTFDRFGYDFGWFIVLYLIAGYIRKYGMTRIDSLRKGAILFAGSAAGIWAISLILHYIAYNYRSLQYYADVPFHYNFILCLTSAIGLFFMFRNIRIREGVAAKLIRYAAPLTLGVYIIHENVDIRDRWLPSLTKFFGAVPQNGLIIFHMLICVLTVFVLCMAVDFIRSIFFAYVSRNMANTKLARKVDAIFGTKNRE